MCGKDPGDSELPSDGSGIRTSDRFGDRCIFHPTNVGQELVCTMAVV